MTENVIKQMAGRCRFPQKSDESQPFGFVGLNWVSAHERYND